MKQMILSTGIRVSGGQLCIDERADERNQPTDDPKKEKSHRVTALACDHRRRLKNASPDNDANDDGAGIGHRQPGSRLGDRRLPFQG